MKIITTGAVAKCTAKGKGTAQTWVPTSQLTEATRYKNFWRFEGCEETLASACGLSNDYSGLDLSSTLQYGVCDVSLSGANLRRSRIVFEAVNVNFTGADLRDTLWRTSDPFNNSIKPELIQSDLTNANLTGAIFLGPGGVVTTQTIFNNTTCPDGTNSNDNGNSCVGKGM